MTIAGDVERIVEAIKPLLAGHPPPVQGAALADLTAIWIVGHIAPGYPIIRGAAREALLAMHMQMVRALSAINAREED